MDVGYGRLEDGSSKDIDMKYLQPVNITVFEKEVLADVCKLKLLW